MAGCTCAGTLWQKKETSRRDMHTPIPRDAQQSCTARFALKGVAWLSGARNGAMVSRRMPAGGLALACVLLGTVGAAVPPGEYTITLPGREACQYRGMAPPARVILMT